MFLVIWVCWENADSISCSFKLRMANNPTIWFFKLGVGKLLQLFTKLSGGVVWQKRFLEKFEITDSCELAWLILYSEWIGELLSDFIAKPYIAIKTNAITIFILFLTWQR